MTYNTVMSTNEVAPANMGKVQPGLTALLAFLIAFWAMAYAPFALGISRPVRSMDPTILLPWLLSLPAIGFGLFASRHAHSWLPRLLAAAAIILAMGANVTVAFGVSMNWTKDPLPALAFLALVVGVGGWLCRQRIIGIGTVLLLLVAGATAMWPGRSVVTLEQDGINASLRLLPHDSQRTGRQFALTLSCPDGTPIRSRVNLEFPDTSARTGLLLPVYSDPISDSWPHDPRHWTAKASIYAPGWARSGSLNVVLQKWPAKPLFSVRIPMDNLPTTIPKMHNGAAWLEMNGIGWAETQSTLPPERCFSFNVRYANTGRYGYSFADFRVRDDQGQDLDFGSTGTSGTETGFEIRGISKRTRWIDFEMFSVAQLEENQISLIFEGVGLR